MIVLHRTCIIIAMVLFVINSINPGHKYVDHCFYIAIAFLLAGFLFTL